LVFGQVLCGSILKVANKNIQQRTLSGFLTIFLSQLCSSGKQSSCTITLVVNENWSVVTAIVYFVSHIHQHFILNFQSISDETSSTSSRSSVTSHSFEVPAPPSDVRTKLNIFFWYPVCFGFQPFWTFVFLSQVLIVVLTFVFHVLFLAWSISITEPRGGRHLLVQFSIAT